MGRTNDIRAVFGSFGALIDTDVSGSAKSCAAINNQINAGDITGIVREQESCAPRYFFGFAQTLEKCPSNDRFLESFEGFGGKAEAIPPDPTMEDVNTTELGLARSGSRD
jgi:hypothetical protein